MADPVEDSLFREVDEELRQEQMAKVWSKYGNFVIGGAVAIVVVVAGYKGWQQWDKEQRLTQTSNLVAAMGLAKQGKTDEALAKFAATKADASAGIAALARLQEAAALARSGDFDGATAAYDAIGSSSDMPTLYRDYAGIQAALLDLDRGKPQQAVARVLPLEAEGNPWAWTAREISAAAMLAAGDQAKAKELYTKIADAVNAPDGIRARAAEMLAALGS